MKSSVVKTIKLPKSITDAFDALDNANGQANKVWQFTPEADAVIVKYYLTKELKAFLPMFCKQFGKVSNSTLRARHKKLTGMTGKDCIQERARLHMARKANQP